MLHLAVNGKEDLFWASGATGESGGHPLGLVPVPVVVPSRSIDKFEWRPHSFAMDGSRLARSLELHREDGHYGLEEELGAAQSGEPRWGLDMHVFWWH